MTQKPTRTWRVTYHDASTEDIKAETITPSNDDGVMFYAGHDVVAIVGAGYRSVVPVLDEPAAADDRPAPTTVAA